MTHYRVDDLPLVLGLLIQMRIAELYDREIGDYKTHTGLSGGWILTIWLTFLISQNDHAKYKVEAWVARNHAILTRITGQSFTPGDFTDNRLTVVLCRLSKHRYWPRFETALWEHSVEVYELAPPGPDGLLSAHVDSTTAYGFHRIEPDGLMQLGHSKDHRPDQGQLKLMTVAMQPFGHLIASQVFPGQTADDPLYLPLIARTREMLGRRGVLYVGDSKMSALLTRAELAYQQDYYLTVAARTGKMKELIPGWIAEAVTGQRQTSVLRDEAGGILGVGYEFRRRNVALLPLGKKETPREFVFEERVQVIRSDAQQAAQSATLEKKLTEATAALLALTPEPGRGHRQHQTEESLEKAIAATLSRHGVPGLLRVNWRKEAKRELRFVGRGRGGAERPTREVITVRYVLVAVTRDEEAIACHKKTLGWRVQLTNAPSRVSLESCVNHYRQNWRGERNYHRLKTDLNISPLFVHRDDQIIGMTNLLTLAARVETILECEVARGLAAEQKKMAGLHSGQPRQETATPTAPTLLKAIVRSEITLSLFRWQDETLTQLTPLPGLLLDVLRYLHLPVTLYTDLEKNSAFDISIFGK